MSPESAHSLYGSSREWSAHEWLTHLLADSSLAEEAIDVCKAMVTHEPPERLWLMALGLSYWYLERFDCAYTTLSRVSLKQTNDVDFLVLFGMVARKLPEARDQALFAYRRAIELQPYRSDVHYNLANLLSDDAPQEALSHYQIALVNGVDHAYIWHNYGKIQNDLGAANDALLALRISLRLNPLNPDVWCNLGLALLTLGRFKPAEACFIHAISFEVHDTNNPIHTSQSLINKLDPEKALQMLLNGNSLDKCTANSVWNLGLLWLLLGKFVDGWRFYEARFYTHSYDEVIPPTVGARVRKLSDLPGTDGPELVVWTEQGLGDGIQFCRYLSLLAFRNVPFRLLVAPEHELLFHLFHDWLGLGDRVCKSLGTFADQDKRPHIPLLSLPLLFGTELHTIPAITPYLTTPSSVPEHLHVSEPPGGLAVGVVWASNPKNKKLYRYKSIDPQKLLPPLIDLIDLDLIELHSLQIGTDAKGIQPWLGHEGLYDWNGRLRDFSETAHVIQQLDLVISVDTAVAHLSGALHKPTWVLLPCNCDFRWLKSSSSNPWYPSVSLFRQQSLGDWDSVIAKLRAALAEMCLLDLKALTEQVRVAS